MPLPLVPILVHGTALVGGGIIANKIWEWVTGKSMVEDISSSIAYVGIDPPQPGYSPSVPSTALTAPYSPSMTDIALSQVMKADEWRKSAIPDVPTGVINTPLNVAGGLLTGSYLEETWRDNKGLFIMGGILLFLTLPIMPPSVGRKGKEIEERIRSTPRKRGRGKG